MELRLVLPVELATRESGMLAVTGNAHAERSRLMGVAWKPIPSAGIAATPGAMRSRVTPPVPLRPHLARTGSWAFSLRRSLWHCDPIRGAGLANRPGAPGFPKAGANPARLSPDSSPRMLATLMLLPVRAPPSLGARIL